MSKYWLVLNTCDSCHHHTLVRTKLGTKEKQGVCRFNGILTLEQTYLFTCQTLQTNDTVKDITSKLVRIRAFSA